LFEEVNDEKKKEKIPLENDENFSSQFVNKFSFEKSEVMSENELIKHCRIIEVNEL